MDTSLYTVVEAAAQLNLTPGAVRDAIARGKIIPLRLGGRGKQAGMLLVPGEQIALYRERHLGKRGAYRRRNYVGDAAATPTRGGTP